MPKQATYPSIGWGFPWILEGHVSSWPSFQGFGRLCFLQASLKRGEYHLKFHDLDSLLPPVAEAFTRKKACHLKPLPFAAAALLAIAMKRFFKRGVVLITESTSLIEEIRLNLDAFRKDLDDAALDFPPLENFGGGKKKNEALASGERLRTLAHLGHNCGPFILNTSIQALMQKTFSPSELKLKSLALALGGGCDLDKATAWLENAAYDFVNEVQERAQVARRGGLLDVWPHSEPFPFRIEFDGELIESIRNFDPADQRSLPSSTKIKDIILPPAAEAAHLPIQNRKSKIENYDSLVKHLPAETIFFWVEKCAPEPGKGTRQYAGLAYHAELYEKAAADSGAERQTVKFSELITAITERNHRQCFSTLEYFSSLSADSPAIDLGFEAVTGTCERMGVTEYGSNGVNADTPQEARQRWLTMLEAKARHGMKIHLFFDTPGALDRFQSVFGRYPFEHHLGVVTEGFLHEGLGLGIISESSFSPPKTVSRRAELKTRRPSIDRDRVTAEKAITDLTDIEPGDLVVHANHGIGKYLGLYEIVFNGKLQETLAVEYADRAKLYVPASQAHLLSRYFTAGGKKARIHRLGGSQWSREKLSAEKAIYDLASSLLEIQALRETITGFAFPKDTSWQHDFEAAFQYEETADQEKAIAAVKADMESPAPMDRLICGDAGYGKTEVAMRAAFKAVMAGKQAAVLVPTTVLALQHYEVFQQRMAAYPVRVELLCRFRSRAEQGRITGDLKTGRVDIVIGTHRLLQPDVAFKDIGLIIIDEEQRFGVEHKEHLKHLKKLSDVLTLSATPIPRTLYMSLTGARKISMVQTPPKDRLPIETIVAKNDEQLVREAILRELNRGGQAFYLHNRIASIEKIWSRLKQVVPEARVAVAHGRMSSHELAATMHEFSRGLFDVLLCTTIVESGVDLPNVNTILIDRADRFGIADLYQLRGRVGRSDRKAYAYLLTPVHGFLLDISRRRLGAVMEHNKLGSGFKLAMMDLEIRGAGNLLGPEQSGHISAIGFDLYCQLLRRTIEHLKLGGKAATFPLGRVGQPCPTELSGGTGPASLGGFAEASCPALPRLKFLYVKNNGKAKNTYPMTLETIDVEVNLDFIDLTAKGSDHAASAFLPADYIEDEETRIKVYRQIASAGSLKKIDSLRGEFKDRFGPLPEPFERLLKIAVMRVRASEKNISTVETREGRLMLKRKGEYLQVKNQFPRLQAADADRKINEIFKWLNRI